MQFPETREQLQDIIKKAASEGRALVPQSSGSPHIHGASENLRAETVSFKKMNHILKLDRHDRYARIESGVTFGELIPEVRRVGLRLNLPFLPRATKSAVASALEREAVLIPKYQFDYTDPLLTVEAVYGNGEVFHTGSAAGPGPVDELKADMVAPWGPGAIDFIRFLMGAQGTMGLVTWATLKAEVLPTQSILYFIEAKSLADLTELCDKLLRVRVLDDCVILNSVNFAAAFARNAAEEQCMLGKLAPWVMICRICGFERYPERRIEIYEKYLTDACRDCGLTALQEPTGFSGMNERVAAALDDCDRREVYWKMRRGGVREVLFLTPPSQVCGHVKQLQSICWEYPAKDIGITVQPQVQGRAYRVECDIFHDAVGMATAKELGARAEQSLFEAGAFFDRPYSKSLAELVYAAFPVATDTLIQLKKVFDPNHIFNPGKLCF